MSKGAWDLRMAFLQEGANDSEFPKLVGDTCRRWFDPLAGTRAGGDREGEACSPAEREDCPRMTPSLLTMMFGSMGELLTQVEVVARRFREAVNQGLEETRNEKISGANRRSS